MKKKRKDSSAVCFFKRAVFVSFFTALFFSCKTPEITTSIKTIIKHDTIVTREVKKDSIIHNIFSKDTIFIHSKNNKLIIKYFYKYDSSAFIQGIIKPDTIIKTYIDTVKTAHQIIIKKEPTSFDTFLRWLFGICLICLIVILIINHKFGL